MEHEIGLYMSVSLPENGTKSKRYPGNGRRNKAIHTCENPNTWNDGNLKIKCS